MSEYFEARHPEKVTSLKDSKSPTAGLKFMRMELKAGAVAQAQTGQEEKYVLVLSGAYKFHLPDGPVALGPLDMLRIPPGAAHAGEALQDTVLLTSKQAMKKPVRSEQGLADQDSDQYLWGV